MPKAAVKKVVKKGKYISSKWQQLLIKPLASPDRGSARLQSHVDGIPIRLLSSENGLD